MDQMLVRVCPTVAIAALAGWLLACASSAPQDEGLALGTSLSVARPETDERVSSVRGAAPDGADSSRDALVGVVVPREQVDLVPRVAGTVASIAVELGERVEAGQLLGRMDPSGLQAELAIALSDLNEAVADRGRASAERRHARRRLRQERKLARAGVVSAASVSDARLGAERSASAAAASAARVGTAGARVKALEQALSRCAIFAPFDGSVAARFRDAGAVVGSGEPVLRIISDERWIRFAAPADARTELVLGRRVQVVTADGVRMAARILNVAPEIDAASGLVFAEATLVPTADHVAAPGAGTPAQVILGPEDVVVLPLSTVTL